MQPKYNYRRRLPHIQKDYRPIFITFTTDHRWQFPPEATEIVLECCLKENGIKLGHVDSLGAYTASHPETGLLIPPVHNS